MSVSGLFLAQQFFNASLPVLNEHIPDIMECSAAGLVGEGSECLGLDDEFSKDHDWGPAFCLWVPDDVLEESRDRIENALALLPDTFQGYPVRMRPEQRIGRVGPLPLRGFYRRFLGMNRAPSRWQEWRNIPEYHLCSCTNGAVFMDESGEFTALRETLLAHYPEDIRRKKLAARCMVMAQCGQYNLPRSLLRGNTITAMLAAARFAEAALSLVFLLNRRYMPFYKWASRVAQDLPLLGTHTVQVLTQLSCTRWDVQEQGMAAVQAIEELCSEAADALRKQKLTDVPGNWLWALGPSIQLGIQEPALRELNVMED